MKSKESGSKMWYWWITPVILLIILLITGYLLYQKYNSLDALNAKIAEKDSIIAAQTAIIESNLETIKTNNSEIYRINTRYKSLKDMLERAAKKNEAIQKPVGESAITECLDKHGLKPAVKK